MIDKRTILLLTIIGQKIIPVMVFTFYITIIKQLFEYAILPESDVKELLKQTYLNFMIITIQILHGIILSLNLK